MLGGWDKQDVAQAQLERVTEELRDPSHVGPFAGFLWAMREIGLKRGTLLDAGCGVGHYGVLCERAFSQIIYVGTDASEAMIAEARLLAPMSNFYVVDFTANMFGAVDIVLASSVVEMLPDPRAALEFMLSEARDYVILNRMRITQDGGPSRALAEHTYCGNIGRQWLWNLGELREIVTRHANWTTALN